MASEDLLQDALDELYGVAPAQFTARRAALATDAGGSDDEESAVCYLQVLLARRLSGFGAERCLADMDAWGYSFREGSARAWFESVRPIWHSSHPDQRGRICI